MSWFDTSGIASLAKTALKEAQKTIDKALDIQDEESVKEKTTTDISLSPETIDPDSFFTTWGLSHSMTAKSSYDVNETDGTSVITKSPTKSNKPNLMSTSLWGSFTGSFFESSKELRLDMKDFHRSNTSAESLTDDSIDEKFSQSKLVVKEINEDYSEIRLRSNSEGSEIRFKDGFKNDEITPTRNEVLLDIVSNIESLNADDKFPIIVKRRERPNSTYFNRLSVISSESGRNSSESVEILGSSGTECTGTPDSDMHSFGHSMSSSSSGLKNSESVEVLADSLTSPSSIGVLSYSGPVVSTDDEFMSPDETDSPYVPELSNPENNMSPDSVAVIPEDDNEESSYAEDSVSFASFSESTTNTVLEQYQIKHDVRIDTLNKSLNHSIKDVSDSTQSDLSLSPDKTFVDAITRPPSKTGMHLALTNTTKDMQLKESEQNIPLVDTQPQISNQSIASLVESPNVINPVIEENQCSLSNDTSLDDGAMSDRTITAGDLEAYMDSSSDTIKTTDSSNAGSSYVKNMLADAMIEKLAEMKNKSCIVEGQSTKKNETEIKNNPVESCLVMTTDVAREQSPLSSESRSDLVKIESEQTSAHTSGDELETTTSSDIEIISSPNGDSSSTQSISRQSPAKLLGYKGLEIVGKATLSTFKRHNRELSETSNHSDDSHFEVEKLLKRISEMTEILEAREAKLVEISRKNMELSENNADIKHQFDVLCSKQAESADVSEVAEEYTKRLSVLEKKFQQAIREKDTYKKQIDIMKQESARRASKDALEAAITEKDDIIKELREEGEKLSKSQLQQSNIIKKLRAKEKETDNIIKNLREQLEESTTEMDRLKRSLTAKEEVECSQIEAVHQLTSKNKKLEKEVGTLKSQLDDATQKLETMKTSLDAAKKELYEKKQASNELIARERALAELENAKQVTQFQNEEIMNQLEDLRDKLRQSEQEYLKKEKVLRQENNDLLRRLESAEARNEQIAESASFATKPLIRQLETLQNSYSFKQSSWEKQEQILQEKLSEAQSALSSLTENERMAKEECISLRSRISSLETKLNSVLQRNDILSVEIEQIKSEEISMKNTFLKQKDALELKLNSMKSEIDDLKFEITSLNEKLSIEKAALEAEKRKNAMLQDQLQQKNEGHGIYPITSSFPATRESSPTLSFGRVSLSESLGSVIWPSDDQFDCGASTNRFGAVYETVRGNPTAILENFQSTLKQRDGELQQLQWELSRRDNERTLLTNELAELTSKLESLEEKLENHNDLMVQYEDMSQKYDAMCQMYGEKVEEVQELKLDLEDVKDMYKTQINELLQQQKKQ